MGLRWPQLSRVTQTRLNKGHAFVGVAFSVVGWAWKASSPTVDGFLQVRPVQIVDQGAEPSRPFICGSVLGRFEMEVQRLLAA